MILSIFIRGKEFYVYTNTGISQIFTVSESRYLADNVVSFLASVLKNDKLKKVIYSAGPGSFTTVRIINSILKGLYISDSSIEFIGVSNFLTYLSVVSKISNEGTIAIPTMRGDYFTCTYNEQILREQNIQNINEYSSNIYEDNNKVFENVNLAKIQNDILNSEFSPLNKKYIYSKIEINYGFTPEYKH